MTKSMGNCDHKPFFFFFLPLLTKSVYIYIYIYILLESKIGFHAKCAVHSPYSHADNQALVNEFLNLKQRKNVP